MAGTKSGGKKAAATNKREHGADFYQRIGAMGGRNGTTGGFAADRELARIAGAKAGKISKRGHRYLRSESGFNFYIANNTGEVVKYKQ